MSCCSKMDEWMVRRENNRGGNSYDDIVNYTNVFFEQATLRKPHPHWPPWRMRKSEDSLTSRQPMACCGQQVSLNWGQKHPSLHLNLNEEPVRCLRHSHGVPVFVTLDQKSRTRPVLESSRSAEKCPGEDMTITWKPMNCCCWFKLGCLLL